MACARADETQLSLSLRKPNGVGPDSVTIQAVVKNVSQHEVTLGEEDPYADYKVTVTNAEGAPVPLSPFGKHYFEQEQRRRAHAIPVKLSPGQSQADTWPLDKFYEFARPGRYRITVHRDFAVTHESVTSNVLDVRLDRGK